MISPHILTHCKRCAKPLSVDEMIEQFCEACNQPANTTNEPRVDGDRFLAKPVAEAA